MAHQSHIRLGNGVVESIVLNQRLQPQQDTVSNVSIGTLSDHVYSYGTQDNGNVLSVADQLNAGRTQTFTYDQLNRLATANESRWGMSYVYDPWGNYLQQNQTGGSTYQHQYTVSNNNRLNGFSYDAAGNLLNDGSHAYVYDPENQIKNVDGGAATYVYDDSGNRIRKDVTGSSSTEYIYFGRNVIAEHDVTRGTWSDYIYANGKRIAKSDNFEDRIHTHVMNCSNCGFQWYQFAFNNAGGLNGRVVQAGDRLMWRQWEASGTTAGIVMGFTDGLQNWSPGVNLIDQHGEGLHTSAILGWNYRIGNLSPAAGKTISYFALGAGGYGAGLWDWYYQDMVFVGADGTVIPLYNHNQTISLYGFGSSGMSQGGYEINRDTNAASYSWWASTMYYHGDQIGSSRLMTSDGGWPVWQGTFLPYGEEYNQQITTNHYKFTGKERDSESGLDYFGARYYGSGLGRFVTADWAAHPIAVPYANFGNPQSLNLFSYVKNNPTTFGDPDGHCCDALAGIGTGVGRWLWNNSPPGMAFNGARHDYKMMQLARTNPAAATAQAKAELHNAGTLVAAVSGNTAAQAQVAGNVVNAWQHMSTTEKWAAGTETVLNVGLGLLSGKIPAPSGVAAESTTLTEGTIFRSGGTNPANITGADLSFRDSLSNPIDSANNPVFAPGDKYFGVDVSKLPEGSAVLDSTPPGHVTVNAPADAIKDAVTVKGKLPKTDQQ